MTLKLKISEELMKTYGRLSEDVSSPSSWHWNCGQSRLRPCSAGRQKDKAWLHGGNRNKFLYLSLYFIFMSSSLARIFAFFYTISELIAKSISCKQPLNSKFIGCIWIFYKVSRKSSLHIEGWSLEGHLESHSFDLLWPFIFSNVKNNFPHRKIFPRHISWFVVCQQLIANKTCLKT